MARQDLAAAFMAAQESIIKEDELRSQTSSGRRESSSEKTVRFGLTKGETSKKFKGYFLTAPGDQFSRRIKNIHRFGCDRNTYGTVGFRCMDPEDYVLKGSDPKDPERGITEAQKLKIKNFVNLFNEISKTNKVKDVTASSDNVYLQFVRNLEIFYMYLVEGVDEEGTYLVTTKSASFMSDRAKWIKTVENMYNNIAGVGPQLYTNFIAGLVDNSVPKTDRIVVDITQRSGYQFGFQTEASSTPFEIPAAALVEMKDLGEQYISKYEVDEAELDKNIAILNSILGKIQGLEAKATVTADLGDVFKD